MECYSIGQNINKTHKISIVKTKLRRLFISVLLLLISYPLIVLLVVQLMQVFQLICQLILVLCILILFYFLFCHSIHGEYNDQPQLSMCKICEQQNRKMKEKKIRRKTKPHIYLNKKKTTHFTPSFHFILYFAHVC